MYPREVATSVEQETAEITDAVAPPANQGPLRRRHTDAIIAWSITYIEPATQHLTTAETHIPTRHARTHQPLRTRPVGWGRAVRREFTLGLEGRYDSSYAVKVTRIVSVFSLLERTSIRYWPLAVPGWPIHHL